MSTRSFDADSSSGREIRSYRLDPALFASTTRKHMTRRLAWSLPLVVLATIVGTWYGSRGSAEGDEVFPWARAGLNLAIILVFLSVALAISLRKQWKAQRAIWDSYQLTVSESVASCHIGGLPITEILRPQVRRISEFPGRGFVIATADRHQRIWVPAQLVGYEDLRTRLTRWRPFEGPDGRARVVVSLLATAVVLACQYAAVAVRDVRWALLAWCVASAGWVLGAREVLRSRIVTNKSKARLIGLFVLVIVGAPLLRAVMFIAGGFPR